MKPALNSTTCASLLAQTGSWRSGGAMAAMLRAYAFDDLRLGMRETLMRTIMSAHISDFAAITGDRNPLVLDDAFAAQTLFGQRIAHGMFTAGMISALIGTRLPGPGAVYLSQTLQFLAPVRIGDVVTAAVEVVELLPARQRVRLFCECRADGRGVLEGEAWVALPDNAPPAVQATDTAGLKIIDQAPPDLPT